MTRFGGSCALVTRAAGGIGGAPVRALRSEGARVAVSDRDSACLEAEVHLDGDLLDGAFCDALPGRAAAALGGLDLVFNNAGVITRPRFAGSGLAAARGRRGRSVVRLFVRIILGENFRTKILALSGGRGR
ncbi:MAG: SDR family NAD(P)-dependent oxidoreductase [Roseovarius sp.]